jgi:pantoate--beta-alanine ligase
VFVPNIATIYPEGFQTEIHNKKMATMLCGSSRPGHFNGVLTVVLKLFNLTEPQIAAFGKKDYQQVKLITQMVNDLNLNVNILACETLREPDGLAMSSRNRYLSLDERREAVRLSQGLFAAKSAFQQGERQKSKILMIILEKVQSTSISIEYIEIRDQKTLEESAEKIDAPTVVLIAAKLGKTRLIDNIELT